MSWADRAAEQNQTVRAADLVRERATDITAVAIGTVVNAAVNYGGTANAGDDLASAPPRGSQKRGTYQLYSNWDFNALGTIFEKETGCDIFEALQITV